MWEDVPSGWHTVGTGDFNGDGIDDIIWRRDDGAFTEWLGQSNGDFVSNDANAFHTDIGLDWRVIGTGDFNGDGYSDVIWRRDDGAFTEWLGQSNGGFVSNDANAWHSDIPTSWQVVGTGDFNGDGFSDIVWRRDDGAFTDWLGQANGGFVSNDANAWTILTTDWQVGGTGDFNGDGRTDILWRRVDGAFTNWLAQMGQANGGFVSNDANAWHSDIGLDWRIAGVGDINGDGRDDVLWRRDDGAFTDWLGQTDGGFVSNDASAWRTDIPTAWNLAGVGDFNGDGRDDVLWATDDGRLETWTGDTTGGLLSPGEQLWQDALVKIQAFFDDMTNQIDQYEVSGGADQGSYYDDGDYWNRLMESESFLDSFGIPNSSGGSFASYLAGTGGWSLDDVDTATLSNDVVSMALLGVTAGTFLFNVGGNILTGELHEGPPPSSGTSSDDHIVVTGHRDAPNAYFTFTSMDFAFSPPDNAGGGGTSDPIHTTPGGHAYHYSANLSADQLKILDKIVDYGFAHGYYPYEIGLAVKEAFYESALGLLRTNPTNSDVEGLYQYDSSTWSTFHRNLNRGSDDDQISAFYSDIRKFETRYVYGTAAGTIPISLSMEDYIEIKHHLGDNNQDWTSPVVNDYEQKSGQLGFGL